jgi:hypothetical protein
MRKIDEPVDLHKSKQPREGIEEKQESTEYLVIQSGLKRPTLIIHDSKHKFCWTINLINISELAEAGP